MMKKLLLISTIVFGQLSFGQNSEERMAKISSDTLRLIDLNPFYTYLDDPDGVYEISDFLNEGDSIINLKTELDEYADLVHDTTREANTFWLRILINNETVFPQQWYLRLGWVRKFTSYQIVDDDKYIEHLAGSMLKGSEREIVFKGQQWTSFICEANSTTKLIVKVEKSWNLFNPEATAFRTKGFHGEYLNISYFEGVFFGILLMIMITSLILFFSTRDKTYLFYLAYVFFFSLFFVGLQGALAQVFLPEYPFFTGAETNFVTVGITFAAYCAFVYKYLDVPNRLPDWKRPLKIFGWGSIGVLIFSILTLFFHGSLTAQRIAAVWIVTVFVTVNVPAVKLVIQKYKPAWLLLAGNGLLTFGIFLELFEEYVYYDNFFWKRGFEVTFLLQVIIFSKGIGNRIRIEIDEKNKAKEVAFAQLEEKVEERTEELKVQKELVEEKNQEITDSITYAMRIQEAILPPDKMIKEHLPNSFVLYKPKDLVAGDFYWMEKVGDEVLFAAADCTGHGVPGAMVSVVCHEALNRSVREFGLTDAGEILGKTRDLVIQTFEKSEEEVKDGMDIALCSLNGNTMKYAGAHNPLWIIRNGSDEIEEIKANKQPIGKFDSPEPYKTHAIELNPGDTIYVFSDGYADQFGGDKGKKFKAANFKKLLLSVQEQSIAEQSKSIEEAFEAWRGSLEQLDDVCVIGYRHS